MTQETAIHIIIRGPAGAGKAAVQQAVLSAVESFTKPPVVVTEQTPDVTLHGPMPHRTTAHRIPLLGAICRGCACEVAPDAEQLQVGPNLWHWHCAPDELRRACFNSTAAITPAALDQLVGPCIGGPRQPPIVTPNTPQPSPTEGAGPAIWDLVVADMRERDNMGALKYGRRLRAHDGRDALVDAYQEALDLAVYLRKEIAQREEERAATPGRPKRPGPSPRDVQRVTCDVLRTVSVDDVRSRSTKPPIVHARHVGMTLVRLLCGESYQAIGTLYGGRDHTTVREAVVSACHVIVLHRLTGQTPAIERRRMLAHDTMLVAAQFGYERADVAARAGELLGAASLAEETLSAIKGPDTLSTDR